MDNPDLNECKYKDELEMTRLSALLRRTCCGDFESQSITTRRPSESLIMPKLRLRKLEDRAGALARCNRNSANEGLESTYNSFSKNAPRSNLSMKSMETCSIKFGRQLE